MIRTISVLLITLLSLNACASVATLNLIVHDDPGAKRAAHNVSYGSEERQKLDVYRPKSGAENAPVVLFIYGGSWNSGNKNNYSFVGNNLAAMGYVAVLPDYRLVPEVVYPDFLEDVALALKWTEENISRYGGDANTIFVAGHSAGAYNAMMLSIDPIYAQDAGVDPSAIKGVIGLSGPYDFYPFDFEVARQTFGHVADGPSTQPINYIDAGDPPLLLITGDADKTVYPRNTVALAKRARAVGVEVSEIHYPDLKHADTLMAMGRPFKKKAPILKEIGAFIEAHR